MNPGRAIKLSKHIVEDYFNKLKVVMESNDFLASHAACTTWVRKVVDELHIINSLYLLKEELNESFSCT